jgi:hypothetical protein
VPTKKHNKPQQIKGVRAFFYTAQNQSSACSKAGGTLLLFASLYRRKRRYTRTDQRNGEALMSTSPANYCLPTQHSFLSAPVKCFGQRNTKGFPTPKLNILKNNNLLCGTSSIKKLRGRLLIIIMRPVASLTDCYA